MSAERESNGQFKKGASGNPHGRPPKGESFAEMARDMLEQITTIDGVDSIGRKRKLKRTYRQLLVESTVKLAINGDASARRDLLDRVDGRVPLPIEADLTGSLTVEPLDPSDFEDAEE